MSAAVGIGLPALAALLVLLGLFPGPRGYAAGPVRRLFVGFARWRADVAHDEYHLAWTCYALELRGMLRRSEVLREHLGRLMDAEFAYRKWERRRQRWALFLL